VGLDAGNISDSSSARPASNASPNYETATGVEIEHAKKRVASNGNKLPDPIRE
jgi:hypothetical protein